MTSESPQPVFLKIFSLWFISFLHSITASSLTLWASLTFINALFRGNCFFFQFSWESLSKCSDRFEPWSKKIQKNGLNTKKKTSFLIYSHTNICIYKCFVLLFQHTNYFSQQRQKDISIPICHSY